MTVQSKLTAIADKIRAILGSSGKMGLDNMATNLTEVNDEVIDQEELIEQIAIALEGKGINGGVNITGETCTITFPENGLSPTVYYLDQNYTTQVKTNLYQATTITVLKNSILMADHNMFGLTFITEGQPLTLLRPSNSNIDAWGIIVHGDTTLVYADNAPQ